MVGTLLRPETDVLFITRFRPSNTSAAPGQDVGADLPATGPDTSYDQAVSAMEDPMLIDSFAEDTKRKEWLDDGNVGIDPASIARMCTYYGHRVTLIDPGATRTTSAAMTYRSSRRRRSENT